MTFKEEILKIYDWAAIVHISNVGEQMCFLLQYRLLPEDYIRSTWVYATCTEIAWQRAYNKLILEKTLQALAK
jgi:hypothetical protein